MQYTVHKIKHRTLDSTGKSQIQARRKGEKNDNIKTADVNSSCRDSQLQKRFWDVGFVVDHLFSSDLYIFLAVLLTKLGLWQCSELLDSIPLRELENISGLNRALYLSSSGDS